MSFKLTEEQQEVVRYLKMYSKGDALKRDAVELIEHLIDKLNERASCISTLVAMMESKNT